MQTLLLRLCHTVVLGLCATVSTMAQSARENTPSIPIIFDTDFVMPPADDGMALMLALQSPELEVLGVTTVAGNDSLEQATSDALRMLEIAERTDVPVYRGADMPLVHAKSEFAVRRYGNWYSNDPPRKPPGGFASKRAESGSAVEFLTREVLARPGEVVIVAIGPLTNVAQAIGSNSDFAASVKSLVIMGGAVASLPDGAGNITPNAEFNFWVDPEAAHVTLRSGIPISLSPLNVSRKTSLDKSWYQKMVAVETPLTNLLRQTLGRRFESEPDRVDLMYDQVAVASLIDPTLVETKTLFVDVDIHHGINYGVSVGSETFWPGAEGAQPMDVQHQLDWPRFIRLFNERIQRPVGSGR